MVTFGMSFVLLILTPRRFPTVLAASRPTPNDAIGDYVAELQLHMTLQARNLVPTFAHSGDSRQQLLHESQAMVEKLVSRQTRSA
jgi:hypothetical protein